MITGRRRRRRRRRRRQRSHPAARPLTATSARAFQLAAARRGVKERRAVGGVRRRVGGAARRRGAEAVDVDGRGAAARRHQSLDGRGLRVW